MEETLISPLGLKHNQMLPLKLRSAFAPPKISQKLKLEEETFDIFLDFFCKKVSGESHSAETENRKESPMLAKRFVSSKKRVGLR